MSILIGCLYVIEVAVCLLLGGVVMLQKPKEGGLGGLAGGMGEAVFGADASNVLIKVTIWLGAIFLANTLLLARFTSTAHSKSLMADQSAPAAQQQPAQPEMPQMPAPAATPVAPAPASPVAPAPAAKPAAPTAPAAKPAAPVAKPAAPAAPAPAAKPAAPAAPAPAAKPAAPAVPTAPAPAPAKK